MRKQRLIAGILVMVMLLGLLPTVSLAAEGVDLSTLVNIAPQATLKNSTPVTGTWLPVIDDIGNLTNGNYDDTFRWVHGGIQDYISEQGIEPSVTLTFHENQKIGGFRIAVQKNDAEASQKYHYHILGKAAGDSAYTELASGEATKASNNCVKTYTLPAMTEFSEIQVAFTNQSDNVWPIFAEIEILGQEKNPYDGLVNVATLSEITVPSEEGNAGKLIDGNLNTLWVASGSNWPSDVDFALPGNLAVKRVELDFEKVSNRSLAVKLSRAVNNVTSDYQALYDNPITHSLTNTFVYSLDEAQRMTHLRISLSSPNPSTLWPAIAEVRIYAVDETIDLNNYDNITSYATPTQGDGYKEWDFGGNQQVAGFKVALPEGVTAVLKGKTKHGAGWTTYFKELVNGDNVFDFIKGMSVVRVELNAPSQLTDLQIFGTYAEPIVDHESVAFEKSAHSNFNAATLYLVNDGDPSTGWKADMYPAYVDIDLEENYNLSEIQVFTPTDACAQYTLYTSMDGRDFDKVGEKLDDTPGVTDGNKFPISKEARIVRVYLEYYSKSAQPVLNEVRVLGTASGSPVQTAPAINVGRFESTDYAAPITQDDTIAEVQGIISRQVGPAYVDWFTFALADQASGYDYFTLSDEGGKIKVTGNDGVSLATGVNHYLKYFCNVNISQVGCQTAMPAAVVPVGSPVHRETRFPVRYAYNYCTHSYSMAFWGEEEWRNELDWLALNGVNVVLDITGQEEVWRQFLMKEGYTHEEAKDFLAGPGYYAWAYMANLTGFGGPVHDSWLTERADLGRKNQRIMRTLGMEPVLQAFSGMVPVDIATHDPNAEIIPQGVWCSFRRPTMLKTNTATYDKYARDFYEAQREVFGDAKYYATDPFHEGGNTGGMSTTVVASALLDSLLDFDSDAVWVIQSWQGNPSTGLLAGLRQGTDRRDHAIVLDLYAEKDQNWKTYGEDTDGDGLKEFSDTPWVFCQLNNFGGRMGLHGHLDALQKNIPAAANTTKHMAGIGIAPEASQENPLLYDFLFETIWTSDANGILPEIDVGQWLKDYAHRRYGAESAKAEEAMAILAETVYKDSLNRAGQGAPESVVNARPALNIGAASTWGNSSIAYNKAELEKAARLLLDEYDTLSQSDAYLYDLADILKQVLSNTAQNIHREMAAAYRGNNAEVFAQKAEQFLALIDLNEQILGSRKEFLFGTWTTNASELAQNADDFAKRLYLRNAKALVTTWGSIEQCNSGGLKDYSNRQWAGLTNDFYKARWEKWINAAKANLEKGSNGGINIDWFPWEWEYARDVSPYSNQPNGLDLKELGEQVLAEFSVQDPLGPRDFDPAAMTAQSGSAEFSQDNNPASHVLDRDVSSIWHTSWSTPPTDDQKWIALDLGQIRAVDGLRYLPRQDSSNGIITGYKIFVSSNADDWNGTANTWTEVASGSWDNNAAWKEVSFATASARYVKLLATSGVGGFASAAEVRITGDQTVPVTGVALTPYTAVLWLNKDPADKTVSLTAAVVPKNATNQKVSWSSGDETVATVDSQGVVTAVGVGETDITVTTDDGSKTNTCTVTVKAQVEDITLNETAITLYTNADDPAHSASLNATVSPANADNTAVGWTSGDPSVASVEQNGKVTARARGTSVITAAAQDESGVSTQCTVTVKTKLEHEISVSGQEKFGSTLTASVNQLQMTDEDKAKLQYQWYRGEDPILGAEDQTYVPVKEDIGQILKVTVTASDPYEGSKSALTQAAITKADGLATEANPTPVDCTTADNNDGKLTGLHVDRLYQYKLYSDTDWTDVPANSTEISGLAPGSYHIRRAETDTHFAGAPSETVTILGFGATAYTVTIPPHFTGGVVRADVRRPAEGETVTLTAEPETGYLLQDGSLKVTLDSDPTQEISLTQEADGTYTFVMPAGDVSVAARFEKKTYTITHSLSNVNCSMGGEHSHTVEHGDTPTITLTADEGYTLPTTVSVTYTDGGAVFDGYRYSHSESLDSATIIFDQGISADLTVTGQGVRKQYTVTYSILPGLSAIDQPREILHGDALHTVLTPGKGYGLPQQVTLTMDGSPFSDFSYDQDTGVITIAEGKVTGNLFITAAGVALAVELESVTITGTPQSGQLLITVVTPSAATVNYEWFQDGEAMEGVTGRSYLLTDTDVGKTFTVKVTGVGGYTGILTSQATAPVVPAPVSYAIFYNLGGGTVSPANPSSYTAETESFTLQNPTRPGYTFIGWTGTGLTQATMTVTILKGSTGNRTYTANWSSDSSSGSSGSSSRPSNTTTVTTTTEDGVKITTITDKKTGDTTVTITTPDGSRGEVVTKGGETTANVTLSQAALDDSEDVPIVLPVVDLAADKKPHVTVELPKGAQTATVSIPAKKLSVTTVAILVGSDGTETVIPQSLVENGNLILSMDAGETIRIEDNRKFFRDVGPADWFAESVAHVTSRELFQGTGGDYFSPDAAMTRGMLVTVLFRYAGMPEGGKIEFPDVEDGAYYTDAVRWASQEKVIAGTGDGLFAPDQVLNREQLAVMLYRYIGSPKTEQTGFEDFSDGDSVSVWAREALAWALETGILQGKDGGRLAPQDEASRAEVSTMLHRFTRIDLLRK